jgi:1,4-alpha-glucan branching enzyme
VGAPIDLPASSWGSGKDWRVWDGEQVADMVQDNTALQKRLLDLVSGHFGDHGGTARDTVADQAVAEAMLALSSDWAFMVTKDSAADYARRRARVHTSRFDELAELLRSGDRARAQELAAEYRRADGPFGQLDARQLLPHK